MMDRRLPVQQSPIDAQPYMVKFIMGFSLRPRSLVTAMHRGRLVLVTFGHGIEVNVAKLKRSSL